MFYIYTIQNKHNNKIYIGKSINPKKRWWQEKNNSFNKVCNEYNYPLSRAFRKYSSQNKDNIELFFTFQIIEEFLIESDVNDAEKFWIEFFNSNKKKYGYNQTIGGDGVTGAIVSKETRLKLSNKLKGRIPWNKNKPGIYTDEHRKKISDAVGGINHPFYGKHHDDNTKNKISKTKQENSRANLNWDIVNSIRSEYVPEQVSMDYLAKKYKIGLTTVYKIIHFITWKI